ncbi:MAG: DUF1456 family protein [Granulosicoccus sp.]
MDTNDLNRRIRYALSLDDAKAQSLLVLGGHPNVSLEQIAAWRMKDTEQGYEACPESSVAALLDGLILDRRGPRTEQAALPGTKETKQDAGKALPLDNNTILKQMRIALSLRSDDVHALIASGGGRLGKTEVSAFFRKSDARNYRRCGDQVMRWFLNGLASKRETE